MNYTELMLHRAIEDILRVINNTKDRIGDTMEDLTEYYKFIDNNIHEICKDLNIVNYIHESIIDNKNTIIEAAIGYSDVSKLDRLYIIDNITLNRLKEVANYEI